LRLLIDTNRMTDLLRGNPAVARVAEHAREMWVPFVTVAEVKAGFAWGNRATANQVHFDAAMRVPGVSTLFADSETVEVYARLVAQLRRSGTQIPTNDLWIASLAVQHGLTVFSRDKHFSRLPQLEIV
jgi:tRNA(fMet)-specific endonuclease VapC